MNLKRFYEISFTNPHTELDYPLVSLRYLNGSYTATLLLSEAFQE